ncbi:MarR family transcriptional regulator [Streptomyces sp. NPDC002130]|uniref:MarR family transcriptional regulator n=1 Tax=Streptomyces sp. NPDC002130 TaxID=3155568 RepID=UPI003323467F
MTVTAFRPRLEPNEVARVTATAAELLEVLWGRASTAPASASQMRVLFILEHHERINLRTLASLLASTPPSTSRLCDRLQAAGLIERDVSRTDRREVRLRLSSRGRALLAGLRVRREKTLQDVLDQMSPADRLALMHGLEAFCAVATAQIHDDDAETGSQTA